MQEALVVRREMHVPAPPAAVFALLTDPDKILRWMGTEAQVEPQQGGLYLVNVTGARFARGSFREVVPVHRLAYSFGRDGSEVVPPGLVTQGSSDLIQTLLANDLIDEINTFTFPIVLGNGKKLFDKGAQPAAFKLVDNRVTTTGVVIACYHRAGDVVTGDYAMDPPTPAELARRERMQREGRRRYCPMVANFRTCWFRHAGRSGNKSAISLIPGRGRSDPKRK
jgi:uncharacterized protein YndB with AHSA1/START domain